ncbi:MAG: phosphatidylinositol-specific phospholipase C1-like protein [Alphaproteobacteria bacterium]|nr:phosphatidylinositol-specific phospholipase C1-like protein [Alphaproteobacteria bacterium]
MILLSIFLACAMADGALRVNDISAVGSHNSYKLPMPPEVMEALRERNARAAEALDYAHRPLNEQLDRGARQIELDVNRDPLGGYYAVPGGAIPELEAPGFKVLHIARIDNGSSCLQLVQCLRILRDWSDAHPRHVPILLMVNAKETDNEAEGRPALRFDEAAFDALDAEIRSILPPDKLITPDDVQGDYDTLREAVLANNWPALHEARGRFLFALDEGPEKVAIYRGGRPSLEGRVFFINTDEHSPAAAYLTLNDPIAEQTRIREAVQAGFLVRTRADADTREARAGDDTRFQAALASGAQYISTDYLWSDPRFSDYEVGLAGGAAVRANPVRRDPACHIAE